MRTFILNLLLMVVLFFGCKNRGTPKNNEVKNNKAQDSIIRREHDSIIKPDPSTVYLKVSAYLIYNDGTLSDFDVLNDKTKALWNVVAGGGDALKPSGTTKNQSGWKFR